MFRVQFDPGNPKRDAVATITFDEAKGEKASVLSSTKANGRLLTLQK
jgi:hypothetical protein